MAAFEITLPQPPQTMLTTNIPYFEVDLREGDGGDVLPNCRDCFEVGVVGCGGGGVGGEGFDVF